jgi:hypothetical protein
MSKSTVVRDNEQGKDQGNVRWQEIDWKAVTQIVSQLQSRIVKAEKEGNADKVQRLRSLLLHSFSAKVLAGQTSGVESRKAYTWSRRCCVEHAPGEDASGVEFDQKGLSGVSIETCLHP